MIHTGDQRTMRSILTTALLEDRDRRIYRKLGFMFGDVTPDTDYQLLAREGQWIFTLNDEKYYIMSSKRHFSLSFFQCVTRPRKMNWQVTRTTDSVHVGILMASSHGYARADPPRCILGLHPENVLQDIPVGENLAMAQTFDNQFFRANDNYLAPTLGLQIGFILRRPG